MNTTELLGVFRSEMFDNVAPYLWSDALVYTYIDDAQKQFCRDTQGIEDARSYKLTIKSDGTEWYAVDPAILKLRDVVDAATGNDIPMIAVEKMRDHNMKFDGTVGPTKALVTGMEKGYVRAYPIPNTAMTLELRTFRLPAEVGAGDDFEIDVQHILNLLLWVKHRAYNVHDSQTYNPTLADKNRAMWDAYCFQAKKEQSRIRRPVSTVTYGGY